MKTGRGIPLEKQLKLLKPDDMDGTKEEFEAYNTALSALERRDFTAVQAYIKNTREQLGFETKES